MKRVLKLGLLISLFISIFVLGGCIPDTIVLPSAAFRTGKVLESGERRVSLKNWFFVPMGATFELGLPAGFQLAGGLNVFNGRTEINDKTLNFLGPELYVSKNLINVDEVFYITTSIGGQTYITVDSAKDYFYSVFGAMGGISLDIGTFPVKWFGFYFNINANYFYMEIFEENITTAICYSPVFPFGGGIGFFFKRFDIKIGVNFLMFDPFLYGNNLDVYVLPFGGVELGFRF
jgi:hypothetical protein